MKSSKVWIVSAAEVDLLLSLILDPQRNKPLVLVSTASDTGKPRIDVAELYELLDGRALVAVLGGGPAAYRLSDRTDVFRTYGGAVRVVWPAAAETDRGIEHPMFITGRTDNPHLTVKLVVGAVARGDRRNGRGGASYVAGGDQLAPGLSERNRQVLSSLTSSTPAGEGTAPSRSPQPAAAPIPKPAPLPAAPSSARTGQVDSPPAQQPPVGQGAEAVLGRVERLLTELPARVAEKVQATMTDWLDGESPEGRAEDAQVEEWRRAEEAEQRVHDLERQLEAAKWEQLATLPVVWDDPEQQFRWEVEQVWLRSSPESERKPLAKMVVCDGFLESLNGKEIIPRGKVLEVVKDVLTDMVWDRCRVHQTKQSKSGETVTRSDGAVMWRVYVKSESPGAPRLHFWKVPDGSVELVDVGHHDDMI